MNQEQLERLESQYQETFTLHSVAFSMNQRTKPFNLSGSQWIDMAMYSLKRYAISSKDSGDLHDLIKAIVCLYNAYRVRRHELNREEALMAAPGKAQTINGVSIE
jgi:hypothetical protein